jgi:hypothetical protein
VTAATAVYGLPLVTTDLESAAEDLVARCASRWGIEQAFADARQIIASVRPVIGHVAPWNGRCRSG